MKQPYDPDYGPYMGHPMDPRTPEDCDDVEQRAELASWTREDLIDEILDQRLNQEGFWGAVALAVKDDHLLNRLRERALHYGIIK